MKIDTYYKPDNLNEACDLLMDEGAAVIAGGGWLKLLPKTISKAVDLSKLDLNHITEMPTSVEIGAMTTLRQVETDKVVASLADGIVQKAVHSIMSVPFRNVATMGGSVAGKFGFSDLLAPLLALDTVVSLHQAGDMSLEAFLTYKLHGDIVTKISIPKKPVRGYYKTVKKTANDFPVVNLSIVRADEACKIVIGSRPGVAAVASEASAFISAQSVVDEQIVNQCCKLVLSEISLGSNIRGSQAYRKDLVSVLVKRGLKEVGYDYDVNH